MRFLSLVLLCFTGYSQTLLQQNYDIRSYQFTRTGGAGATGSLSTAGAKTVTLAPVPKGLNGADANHWINISGPAAATTIAVTSATNGLGADPIVVTTATNHGLSSGATVSLSGMANPMANGTWTVSVTGATTFQLVNSITAMYVARATNATPIVITIGAAATTDHGIQTGNTVVIGGVLGNTAANGTFVATRINAYSFSLNSSVGNGDYLFSGASTVTGTYTSSSGIVTYGPEAVLITGGTAVSGAASGTVTFTTTNPHAAGYSITSATAGAAEAVIAATPSDMQNIYIPCGNWTWQAGLFLPSNTEIAGEAGCSKITLAAGYPKVSLISAIGARTTTTTSTTSLTEANRSTAVTASFNVASASGLAAGDLLYMEFTGSGTYYSQLNYIRSISSSTLTMRQPIMIPLSTSETGNVEKVVPITNVVIRDLILDGGTSNGANQALDTLGMTGIDLRYVTNSRVQNVTFQNWTRDAGLHMLGGNGNKVDGLSAYNSGCLNLNDLTMWYQTDFQVSNIDSKESSGFGPGIYFSINAQVSNVSVTGPVARAFKVHGNGYSQYSNISISGSRYYNGMMVSGGSYQSKFSNVISNGNAYEGILFFGDGNQYLTFDAVTTLSNGAYRLHSGEGGHPIRINAGDTFITLRNVNADSYILDLGASDTIGLATVLRAQVYNTIAQTLTSGANTALTFDTEAEDIGGLHSTVSATSRLTLPVWAGGSPVDSPYWAATPGGRYTVCGGVQFAANATGQRGVQLVKTSGITLTTIAYFLINASSAGVTIAPACGIVQLAAGDYVELYAIQNSGSPVDTVPGDGNTFLSIQRAY